MNFREAEDQAFSQLTIYAHAWGNPNRRPPEYHWCQWCEGFYGRPHVDVTPWGEAVPTCGSAPHDSRFARHRVTGNCACRHCEMNLGTYGVHGSFVPAYLVNIHNQTFAA